MEILKGFSWDLQRFATSTATLLDLSEVATALDAYANPRADNDKVALDGSGNVVIQAASGAGTALATLPSASSNALTLV